MINPVEEAILRSYAVDYMRSHNADSMSKHKDRAKLVEHAMKICGYRLNHRGEYEKDERNEARPC